MWKLLQMAVKSKIVRNMVLSFVAGLLLAAIVMVTNLQKTLCSLPLMNKLEFCQEDFRPIKDEKLTEIARAIHEMRESAVNDNGHIGEKFEDRETKYDEGKVSEAEVYLRALINLDMAVLNDSDVKEENLEGKMYEGTNLAEMWKVVKAMKASDDYKDVRTEAEKNNWEEKEWLQYAQLRVYSCYLVGNEVDTIDGKFWGALKGIVGMDHEPCEELERLLGYQYVKGGGTIEVHKFPDGTEKKLIDHGNIAVVKQKVTIYEYYEYCHNPNANARANLDAANIVYADTKDRATESTRGDCNAEEEKKSEIKERTELAYLTKMNIVEGFEKYSLYQKTKNGPVPEKEMSFKDKLRETVAEVYKEVIGTPITGGMGSIFNGWLIPLEEGTYYRSSPYGPRSDGFHFGTDLPALGKSEIPIYAAADGVVEFANPSSDSPVGADPTYNRESGGCGGRIVIRHTNGWMTGYCHMKRSNILVQTGWEVKQGQILTATGNEGGSDGAHLHFSMCTPVPSYAECSSQSSNQIDSENHEGAKLVFNKDSGKLDNALIAKRQKEFQDLKQKINELPNKSKEEVSKLLMSLSPMASMGGGKEPFGILSAFFETTGFGKPEYCVNNPGDNGGLSCGTWQFTHYSQKDFTSIMKAWGEIELYNILSQGTPGNEGSFKPAWERAAQVAGAQKFYQLQKRFVIETYYQMVINYTKEVINVDITTRSYAMQEAMFSLSIQHGPSGKYVLKDAFGQTDLSQKDDAYILNGMYEQRKNTDKYFVSSSIEYQYNLRTIRFPREQCIVNTLLQDPSLGNALVQGQTSCPYKRVL